MSGGQYLRRYNQIMLAVFLTVALFLLGFLGWRLMTEFYAHDEYLENPSDAPVSGEEYETPQGTITKYEMQSSDDSEAVRDVRYVAMATGKVTALSDDADALIYGEKAVGELGRIALVKTGTRDDRPLFDIVFIGFPDLERFVVARSIDSLDTVQQLDDAVFSAIIWDNRLEGRFVVVDAKTGAIQSSRNLDFSSSRKRSGGAAAVVSPVQSDGKAPRNKFVF